MIEVHAMDQLNELSHEVARRRTWGEVDSPASGDARRLWVSFGVWLALSCDQWCTALAPQGRGRELAAEAEARAKARVAKAEVCPSYL